MVDTTAQHIATREDDDLRQRLIASAEQARVPNPEQFVSTNIGKIISTPIDGDTTLTTVHAYAAEQYRVAVTALPPKPGVNPAAVTDTQLADAISAVWSPAPEV